MAEPKISILKVVYREISNHPVHIRLQSFKNSVDKIWRVGVDDSKLGSFLANSSCHHDQFTQFTGLERAAVIYDFFKQELKDLGPRVL